MLDFFLKASRSSFIRSISIIIELILVGYFGGFAGFAAYSLVINMMDTASIPILGFQNGITYILNRKNRDLEVRESWASSSIIIGILWTLLMILLIYPLEIWIDYLKLQDQMTMVYGLFTIRVLSLLLKVISLPLNSFMQVKTDKPIIAKFNNISHIASLVLMIPLTVVFDIWGIGISIALSSLLSLILSVKEFSRQYRFLPPSFLEVKTLIQEGWWNWAVALLDGGASPLRTLIATPYGPYGVAVLNSYRVLREPSLGLSRAIYETTAHFVSKFGPHYVNQKDVYKMILLSWIPAILLIPFLGTDVVLFLGLTKSSMIYAVLMTILMLLLTVVYGFYSGFLQGTPNGSKKEAINNIISSWLVAYPIGFTTSHLYPDSMDMFALGYFISPLVLLLLIRKDLSKLKE